MSKKSGYLNKPTTPIFQSAQSTKIAKQIIKQPEPKPEKIPQDIQFYSDGNISCAYSFIKLQKNKESITVSPKKPLVRTNGNTSRNSNNQLSQISPGQAKIQFDDIFFMLFQEKTQLSICYKRFLKTQQINTKELFQTKKFDKSVPLQKIKPSIQNQTKNKNEKQLYSITFKTQIQSLNLLFQDKTISQVWKVIFTKILNDILFKNIFYQFSSIKKDHFLRKFAGLTESKMEDSQKNQMLTAKLHQKQQLVKKYVAQNQSLQQELQSLRLNMKKEANKADIQQNQLKKTIQKFSSDKNRSEIQVEQKSILQEIHHKFSQIPQHFSQLKNKTIQKGYFELQFKKIESLQKKIDLTMKNSQNSIQKDYMDEKFEKLESGIKMLMKQRQKKQDQSQSHAQLKLKAQESKLLQEISTLQKKHSSEVETKITEIKSLEQLVTQLQQTKLELNAQISQLEGQVQQKDQDITLLNEKIITQATKEDLNDKQLIQIKQVIKSLEGQNLQLKRQQKQSDQKVAMQVQSYKEQISSLNRHIVQLQSQADQGIAQQQQRVCLQRELHVLRDKVEESQCKIFYYLFQGRVLNSCLEQKRYLKNQIQSYTKKQILFTPVLYKYDPLNPTNYHRYFDQHQNICLLVKLKNGRIISGFSQSPVSSKNMATKGGIIFSLTQKKSFKLLEGKRSVTYDMFFLIFGNSQLRLKFGQMKFFTNFGIANSFYQSNGEKYTVLNGEDTQREEILVDFEIFEIIFK